MKPLVYALTLSAAVLGTVFLKPVEPSQAQATAPVSATLAPTLRPSVAPIVRISTGATPARTTLLNESMQRFDESGLLLPDLEVHFYDRSDECRGHLGLYQPQFSPPRVLVCSELDFVLPHELAHAWEAANLDDDDRQQYVEAEGLETWADPSADREQRGIEDAAFIIQQNLTATKPNLSSSTWERRTEAYLVLTGRASPLLTATSGPASPIS